MTQYRDLRTGPERRGRIRYALVMFGTVWPMEDHSQIAYGETVDISRSGLAIAIARKFMKVFSPGKWIQFELEIPAGPDERREAVLEGIGRCVRISSSRGHCLLALRLQSARVVRRTVLALTNHAGVVV